MADIANIDNMAAKLAQALTEYDQGVADAMKEVIDEQSDETVDALKSKSPKRSGAYAKGWRKKQIYETRAKKQNTVYNAKKHQLTHLLEKGHRRKNTDRAGVTHTSRTPTTAPRVHIAPVEQQMIKELEEKIKKVAKG